MLLCEEDWNAINETLYLVSIPGMRESIREGMDADLAASISSTDWFIRYTKKRKVSKYYDSGRTMSEPYN